VCANGARERLPERSARREGLDSLPLSMRIAMAVRAVKGFNAYAAGAAFMPGEPIMPRELEASGRLGLNSGQIPGRRVGRPRQNPGYSWARKPAPMLLVRDRGSNPDTLRRRILSRTKRMIGNDRQQARTVAVWIGGNVSASQCCP